MTLSEFEEENRRKYRELAVRPGKSRTTNHTEWTNAPKISLGSTTSNSSDPTSGQQPPVKSPA